MMPPSWRAITDEHLTRWRERLAIPQNCAIDRERQARMCWVWLKLSNDPTARELRGGVVTLAESDYLHSLIALDITTTTRIDSPGEKT